MDVDCYVCRDFSDVFDGQFDLAVTRMFSNEAYANQTINCGVWFAHSSPRLLDFVREWQRVSDEYRAAVVEAPALAPIGFFLNRQRELARRKMAPEREALASNS